MRELREILAAMVKQCEQVADRQELLLDMGERVAKTVAREFACRVDEVAILLLTSDGHHLRFIAPRPLSGLGTIPMTKRDSIAVGVLNRGTGEVTNNVPTVRHVSFFEAVKLREKPSPIQKMVTVPIQLKGRAIGVAQVSRKGENPREAGPDFNDSDMAYSLEIFEAVAPYLHAARPSGF